MLGSVTASSQGGFSRLPTELVGENPRIVEVRALITEVARSNCRILIEGESGVGKEVVAHLIQRQSLRSDQPFLLENCAAIPEALFESEFFGHERGAFTGAIEAKKGLFEAVNHGTLFFDDIDSMSLQFQAKLLRVLEMGQFRHVGGIKSITVDVRLITASNQSLYELVRAGKFRSDLYYRLAVVVIYLPPLRERFEDIPVLANHFLKMFDRGSELTPSALRVLQMYDWPGNVRELQNVLERAVVLSNGERMVAPEHLGLGRSDLGVPSAVARRASLVRQLVATEATLEEIERDMLAEVIERYPTLTAAADALGIHRTSLYDKMRRFKIERPSRST